MKIVIIRQTWWICWTHWRVLHTCLCICCCISMKLADPIPICPSPPNPPSPPSPMPPPVPGCPPPGLCPPPGAGLGEGEPLLLPPVPLLVEAAGALARCAAWSWACLFMIDRQTFVLLLYTRIVGNRIGVLQGFPKKVSHEIKKYISL